MCQHCEFSVSVHSARAANGVSGHVSVSRKEKSGLTGMGMDGKILIRDLKDSQDFWAGVAEY